MVSQRKQIANQSNASKSTGPRTDEGKRRSTRNRLRHGFFSSEVVLPGEDGELYAALLAELVEEHKPQTPSQMLCVQRVAACMWKLWQLDASFLEAHEQRAITVCHHAAGLAQEAHDALRHNGKHVGRWDILWRAPAERVQRIHDRAAARTARAPAAATLAASMAVPSGYGGGEFERLGRYEQRLQHLIHRALTELRKLREEHDAVAELPPSPYAAEEGNEEGESSESEERRGVEPDADGEAPPRKRPTEPVADAPESIVRNEPTATATGVAAGPPA